MASLPAHARYTVVPIECGDLPSLLDIWAAAFEDDAHTRMKMTEKGETNVRSQLEPLQSLEASFGRPGVHMFKVVDEGRMVGFSNWREWNFDIDVSEAHQDSSTAQLEAPVVPPFPLPTRRLERLEALTSNHLTTMMTRLNRPPSRTLFCTAIAVLPSHQGRGVASALLDAATTIADGHGAVSGAHVSDHGGVRAFDKVGYQVVNSLTLDLDEYATKERPGGGRWGRYTFRMMVREPRAVGRGDAAQ